MINAMKGFSWSLCAVALFMVAGCMEHKNAYLDLQRAATGGTLGNVQSESANEALVYALVTNDIDLVVSALEAGADPYHRIDHVGEFTFGYYPHGETGHLLTYPVAAASALLNPRPCVLWDACGDMEAFALVRSRAALDAMLERRPAPGQGSLDQALLVAASLSRDPDLFARLVELGANLEAVAEPGWRPLHLAVRDGNLEAVAALLALGADPDGLLRNREALGDIWSGGPSLLRRYEKEALHLDTAGYPMEVLYTDRLTPLHMAAIGEVGMETSVFLRFNTPSTYITDIAKNARPARWAGPPAYALLDGDVSDAHRDTWAEIMRRLLDAGADPDAEAEFVNGHATTTHGWTPLHFAYFTDNEQAVEILTVHGASETAPLSSGERPEDVAGGYSTLVQYVVAREEEQRHEQVRQKQIAARAESDGDDANLFGRMMALGSMAAVTAAGASAGMGGDALTIGLAGATDILTDGEAEAIRTVQEARQQSLPHSQAPQPVGVTGGGGAPDSAIPGFQAPATGAAATPQACTNTLTVDRIAHSFLRISLATPAGLAATASLGPVRGGATGDRAVQLEVPGGAGNLDRLVATILIPGQASGPASVPFIDDNTVAGLESGAVATFDAWRGREYANFRTNFDYGRNRSMGTLAILATSPHLIGRFSFQAVEDGYPRRGEQYMTEVSGTFCVPA